MTLHDRLNAAAERFDTLQLDRSRRSPRGYHKPYALALYRERVARVVDDVANGATERDVIIAAFTGSLRTAMLRAIGQRADACDVLLQTLEGK